MVALLVLLILNGNAQACSLVQGYFHQVTYLRGKVVDGSLGRLRFSWWRRLFPISRAELTLYHYDQPFDWNNKPPAVAKTRTTLLGQFEFGDIEQGHYRLEISDENHDDLFDVEITNQVSKTKSILIDISPLDPDCTGGHQFEVEAEKR
jgi:hypothetical protein